MTGVISVCNWERFQHYKDRDPPWVKLYRDLLTTESWVLGTDTSRLVQVASILLAARYNNKIPYQWALIRKVSSLDCTEQEFTKAINHLVSAGFLELQGVTDNEAETVQPASGVLATCSTEGEAEQRQSIAEQRRPRAPLNGAARASPIPENWEPNETNRQWLLDAGLSSDQQAEVVGEFVRWARNSENRKSNWDLAFSRNPAVKSAVGRAKCGRTSPRRRLTRFEELYGSDDEDD